MAETRKLAAILAADVVGFSRLTGADEDRTLARLRALRSDLIDPTIAVHNGRVVKRTGDGALVEFRSVVDAVRCAVEVQNAMVERNAGDNPDPIQFNLGATRFWPDEQRYFFDIVPAPSSRQGVRRAVSPLRATVRAESTHHPSPAAPRRHWMHRGGCASSFSGGNYSGTVSPDPPSSAGKSFIFGSPSFIGSTVSE